MSGKPKSSSKDTLRDLCQTPSYALAPILRFLPHDQIIWEPARGKGFMVRALEAAGRTVVSGDILTGQDFFDSKSIPEKWDILVTNPPFSIKYKWLQRCCGLEKPFALLMPLDVLGAAEGQKLIEHHDIEIVLMSQRIDYFMPNLGFNGHGSQFASAWFTRSFHIGKQLSFADIYKPKRSKIDEW